MLMNYLPIDANLPCKGFPMADVDINKIPIHGYAAAALHLYKNKMVEINTGEVKTTLLWDQFQKEIKHVIRGVIKDAIGDALIIEVRTAKGIKSVLINCWSINSIVAVDGNGTTTDVYFDEDVKSK